jgi:hypothetical protein
MSRQASNAQHNEDCMDGAGVRDVCVCVCVCVDPRVATKVVKLLTYTPEHMPEHQWQWNDHYISDWLRESRFENSSVGNDDVHHARCHIVVTATVIVVVQ